MVPEDYVHAELRRLRDRIHDIESRLRASELLTTALVRNGEKYAPLIDQMIRSDEIADAVADRLKNEHQKMFTFGQKVIIGLFSLVVGGATIGDFILRVFSG